jgi:hypothetical protein
MTPKQFASALEDTILSAKGDLLVQILNIQDIIYDPSLSKLKILDLDANGLIKQNAFNRAIAADAGDAFTQAIKSSGYLEEIQNYIDTIPKLDLLAENYFLSVSDAFKPNRQFLASLQKQTIASLETTLFNEGLESQIKRPLMDVIYQNINSGGQFSGFLDQVKGFVKGSDVDGKLLSYVRTLTRDALFNYARAYQQSVTNDLGLVWYFYLGGADKTSRDFCLEHVDQYWHESEIKEWPKLDWAGKRPDTTESSIWIYLGGSNCKHSLVPVSDVVVPKEVIDRLK